VLNCAIAMMLYQRFPQLPEGDLSRLRASLVNRDTLHRLALTLDLGGSIRLGEGELKSGGAGRVSILADALEALLGAILLDGGFESAYAAIERLYGEELTAADAQTLAKDPKTRLQEWLQGRRLPVPEYAIVGIEGEAHLQTFEVVCRIPALNIAASGSGTSRRAAEQAAAGLAYEQATRT
jgi:ribonuclease III